MIFDGKPLIKITDDEIRALVTDKVGENQHLEFKATVNYKEEKLEILRDIASLANGGGGYFIVGIGEDGEGRAVKFEKEFLKDPESTKKSIKDLCLQHITEKIYGLEIERRTIDGSPLIFARIPDSDRKPHMVTYESRTDFWIRHHDRKRVMTTGEIKEAFLGDIVARRLDEIESAFKSFLHQNEEKKNDENLRERIERGEQFSLLEIENGEKLSKIASEQFAKEISKKPCFWISITPTDPQKNLINVDSEKIHALILNPPDARHMGWNTKILYASIERFGDGIRIGQPDYRFLILLSNGHMEFWVPLDKSFCWQQTEEEFSKAPRLYPYPVNEFPVSFLKLYHEIVNIEKLQTDFILSHQYRNLSGYNLAPYRPGIVGFDLPWNLKPFENKHLVASKQTFKNNFDPDKEAFGIIKHIYHAFGHDSEAIPFFDKEVGKYTFPS